MDSIPIILSLIIGIKSYDRVYGSNFRGIYYGYYTEESDFNQEDKYKPVKMGSLSPNSFSISGTEFSIISLLAMNDKRREESNLPGYTYAFILKTPQGIIPFKSITIMIDHQCTNANKENIQCCKTFYDTDFSTDNIYIRKAIWYDINNELFNSLEKLYRCKDGEINIKLRIVMPDGKEYSSLQNIISNGTSISLPLIENNSVLENKISLAKGFYSDDNPISISHGDLNATISIIGIHTEIDDNSTSYSADLLFKFISHSFSSCIIQIDGIPDSKIVIEEKDIINNTYEINSAAISSIWKVAMETNSILPIHIELRGENND